MEGAPEITGEWLCINRRRPQSWRGPGSWLGPRRAARNHVGVPVSPACPGPPLRLWGSSASSGVRKKLRSQPKGQAGGNWSPTPKGETEAWEVGGCGKVHPSSLVQANHTAPVAAVLMGVMGVGKLACPFSGPQGQARRAGGGEGSWQPQSMIPLHGR